MKIAVASDLHLEMHTDSDWELLEHQLDSSEKADVLVLAGDIITINPLKKYPFYVSSFADNTASKQARYFKRFFDKVSSKYAYVLVVMGNHEFYGGNFIKSTAIYRKALAFYENVLLLEDDTFALDGITFVGASLWTSLNNSDPNVVWQARQNMNDYYAITTVQHDIYRKLNPLDTVARHKKSLKFIKEQVALAEGNAVVVTHHAPHPLSIVGHYRNDNSGLSHCYMTNLDEYIARCTNLPLWIHGHTHSPIDYTVENTRVVCNTRGYPYYEPASVEDFEVKVITLV